MFWLYLTVRRLWSNQFRSIYGDFAFVDFPFPWRSRTFKTMRPRTKDRPAQPPGTYG